MSELIPEGKYSGEVQAGHEYVFTKAGGVQYLVHIKVDAHGGLVRPFRANVEGAGAEFGTKALQAMGMVGDDPQSIVSGKRVQVVIEHEEWQGEKRDRIKYVNPIGGGSGARPDAARIAQIRKRIASIVNPSAVANDNGAAGLDATGSDDPFGKGF